MASAERPGDAPMRIEVVFSPRAGEVDRTVLELPPSATLADALAASGLAERHPEVNTLPAGIWGREQPPDTPLRDRDRVEVYRGLKVDPKEARRLRYKRHKAAPPAATGSSSTR